MPTAASIAALGFPNEAKKPSPVFLITSPPRLRDPLANELVVAREQLLPLVVAEGREQLRRVDDVGEEERAARLEPAEELVRALLVEPGAEPLERRQRSLELDGSAVLVTPPPKCDAEQHARLRGLVGRADPLPLVSRQTEALRGAVPVLLGELDPAGRDMDRRVERRSAPPPILYESTTCSSSVGGRRARSSGLRPRSRSRPVRGARATV